MFFTNAVIAILNVVLKRMGGMIMEKIISRILEEIIKNMSPEIRKEIIEAVMKLDAKAKATVNPWDNLLVFLLKIILDID